MSWSDSIATIGLVTGLLGIPSSIFSIWLIWREFAGVLEKVDKIHTEIEIGLASARSEDRILLDFKKDRATIPGSFEHIIYKFKNAVPRESDKDRFVYNPLGVLRAHKMMYLNLQMLGYAAVLLLFVLWLTIMLIPPTEDVTISSKILTLLERLGISAFLLSWCYLAFRYSRQSKRACDAAQTYVDYLQKREIFLDIEFTQSKKMFEQEQSTSAI